MTIDAMPNKTFTGNVIEIGNTAILRSTGLAASQSATSSQEAKDFKVVVALDNPPDEIRPGLSCTAKITTATRHERADDSDPGADGAHQGRSGEQHSKTQRRQHRRRSIRRKRRPGRKKCRACSWSNDGQGGVPQSGDRASPAPPISKC